MVVIRGRLAPEVGAVLLRALDAARETLYQRSRETAGDTMIEDVTAEAPTMAQLQADALALVAETALHRGTDPGVPGDQYQVVVHVDAPMLADTEAPGQSVLEDGTHVSAETCRRLACDARRVVMRHDAQGASWRSARARAPSRRRYGARSTTATEAAASRAAGCDSVRGITSGIGRTTAPRRCRISHCSVVATTVRFTRRGIASIDSPTERSASGDRTTGFCPQSSSGDRPRRPRRVLRARHHAHGLHVHARTSMPGWLGERVDVGWAIDVLHPLAAG
jgi:hypothetical protein